MPKKCIRWITVEWEEAAETWMIDLRFETAPPGHEWVHIGLGHTEMKELAHKLNVALRSGRKGRSRMRRSETQA